MKFYRIQSQTIYLLTNLLRRINDAGGFINSHAHFDRAYTAQTSDFELDNVNAHLFEKWELVEDYFLGKDLSDQIEQFFQKNEK